MKIVLAFIFPSIVIVTILDCATHAAIPRNEEEILLIKNEKKRRNNNKNNEIK